MDPFEHIQNTYRCQFFKISTEANENVDYIFQHVIKRFLDENKYIFNIALYTKTNDNDVYHPQLELEFPYVVRFDNNAVKLIITDPTASTEFSIVNFQFSKKTKSFVSLFDVSSPNDFVEFRNLIKEASEFFSSDVSIVVGALNCKLYQQKDQKNLLPEFKYKLLEEEFNCKVIELYEGDTIDKVFLYVAQTNLSMFKAKNHSKHHQRIKNKKK